MKHKIVTQTIKTINVKNVDTDKFIVFAHKAIEGDKGILLPDKYGTTLYQSLMLNDTLKLANGWSGPKGNVQTIAEWVDYLTEYEFYTLDTFEEVLEFAKP